MGQRHQVYAVVQENSEIKVVGIHHQWLYGRMAIELLGNVLKFHGKSGKYGPFRKGFGGDAQAALGAAYSIDTATGYFHSTHVLDAGETLDPRRGDNNDGITVIDFRGKKPRYCFMNLGEGDSTIMKATALEPLSAEEYVRLYYPTDTAWYESYEKARPKIEKEIQKLLKRVAKYERLRKEEVKKLFPAMFKPLAVAI